MRRWFFMLTLFFLFSIILVISCQKSDPVVAKIGKNRTITLEEFKKDYLTTKQVPDFKNVKKEDLENYLDGLAENQMKLEVAYDMEYDKIPDIIARAEARNEKIMLIRLREVDIIDKLIKDSEAKDFYSKTDKEVEVSFISFNVPEFESDTVKDSILSKAKEVLSKIRNGEDFEKVAFNYSEDKQTRSRGGKAGKIKYSSSVNKIQNAAFNMKKGEVSDVISIRGRYIILKVDDIYKVKREPFKEARNKIMGILVGERESEIKEKVEEYKLELEKNENIEFDQDMIHYLAEKFKPVKKGYAKEYYDICSVLPDSDFVRPIVSYNGGRFGKKELIESLLMYDPYQPIMSNKPEDIQKALNNWIITKLLLRRAKELGLDKDAFVRDKYRESMDNLLINYMDTILNEVDEPTEEQIFKFYLDNKNKLYDMDGKEKDLDRMKDIVIRDLKKAMQNENRLVWFKEKLEELSVKLNYQILERIIEKT